MRTACKVTFREKLRNTNVAEEQQNCATNHNSPDADTVQESENFAVQGTGSEPLPANDKPLSVDQLLTLLEQEEIQMKLFQIFTNRLLGNGSQAVGECKNCQKQQSAIDSLTAKINHLESRLTQEGNTTAKLKQDVALAREGVNQAEQRVQQANAQLAEQQYAKQALEKKLAGYRESFEDDLRIHNAYLDFSAETKSSLAGIFKDTSTQGLIACGIQEANIGNLWDYAKNEVIHGGNPDEQKLVTFFELLFKRFALAYPAYRLETELVGTEFDHQAHIKHQSSVASSGTIKKVCLPGYTNTRTNKPIKQSVVML